MYIGNKVKAIGHKKSIGSKILGINHAPDQFDGAQVW